MLAANKMVMCLLCQQRMRHPRTMPCAHSFCRECLDQWIDNRHLDRNWDYHACRVPCPVCRKVVPRPSGGAKEFPTNESLKSLCGKISQMESNNKKYGKASSKSACGDELSDSGISFSCETSSCQESTDNDDDNGSVYRRETNSSTVIRDGSGHHYHHHRRRNRRSHHSRKNYESSSGNDSSVSSSAEEPTSSLSAEHSAGTSRHNSDYAHRYASRDHSEKLSSFEPPSRIIPIKMSQQSVTRSVHHKHKPISHVPRRSENDSTSVTTNNNQPMYFSSDNKASAASTKLHMSVKDNAEVADHILHSSDPLPPFRTECDTRYTQESQPEIKQEIWTRRVEYIGKPASNISAGNSLKKDTTTSYVTPEKESYIELPLAKCTGNQSPAKSEVNESASFISSIELNIGPIQHYECHVDGQPLQNCSQKNSMLNEWVDSAPSDFRCDNTEPDLCFKDELAAQIERLRIKHGNVMVTSERDVKIKGDSNESLCRGRYNNAIGRPSVLARSSAMMHKTSQQINVQKDTQMQVDHIVIPAAGAAAAAKSAQHVQVTTMQPVVSSICCVRQEIEGSSFTSDKLQDVKGFVHNLSRQYSLLAAQTAESRGNNVPQKEESMVRASDVVNKSYNDNSDDRTQTEYDRCGSGYVNHLSRQYSSMVAQTAADAVEKREAQTERTNTHVEQFSGKIGATHVDSNSHTGPLHANDTRTVIREQLAERLDCRCMPLLPESPDNERVCGASESVGYTVLGQYGHGLLDFTNPVGLAILPSGSVAVSDQRARRVMIFDSTGRVKQMIICSKDVGNIAFSSDRIWVAVCGCDALAYEFKHDGLLLKEDIGREFGQVGAYGLSVVDIDVDHSIMVACSPETNRLYVIADRRHFTLECDNLLRRPAWVALTPDGTSVWVSDESCLRRFNMLGVLLVEIARGCGAAELLHPAGMCLDDDHVIVADSGNKRIQRYTHDGRVIDTFVTLPLWPANVALGDGKLAVLMVGAKAEVRLYPYTR